MGIGHWTDSINIQFEFNEYIKKSKLVDDHSLFNGSLQSLGSMDAIDPIRPDDQTLDDLFQKAIVSEFVCHSFVIGWF